MTQITNIVPSIIKDSRGNETISVTAYAGEHMATFSVPSGASTGAHEALELRDPETKSVTPAILNITHIIAPALIGHEVSDQKGIDAILCRLAKDTQKTALGANSTLAVSGAIAQLGATVLGMPLYTYLRRTYPEAPFGTRRYPLCFFNLINGGKHANNGLAFQEYHVVPDCGSVQENVRAATLIYQALGVLIQKRYPQTPLGDEGGYAIAESDVVAPLMLLRDAVRYAGYEGRVSYALDVAASSFLNKEGRYEYAGGVHSAKELAEVYMQIANMFPMISIEDPFEEEAFNDFAKIKKVLPQISIIGDDLTVTQVALLDRAIETQAIGGLIIKPNQIGTITETVQTIARAHTAGLHTIISHRSGETLDTTIADIARAFHCFGLKAGAPGPRERMVKYERLMAITTHIV